MKTGTELAAQHEMDMEILHYVRGMQSMAPVTAESVLRYLKRARRWNTGATTVGDRLIYCVGRGWLDWQKEWVEGDGWMVRYEITAGGQDVLDGVVPVVPVEGKGPGA